METITLISAAIGIIVIITWFVLLSRVNKIRYLLDYKEYSLSKTAIIYEMSGQNDKAAECYLKVALKEFDQTVINESLFSDEERFELAQDIIEKYSSKIKSLGGNIDKSLFE